MKALLFLFFNLFFFFCVFSQSVDISSLFQPGVRVGGLFMPSHKVNDSVSYSMYRIRTTGIIPLNGKVNVDIGKLNIGARQSFLTLNAGVRETKFSPVPSSNLIYNFALGFTQFRASLASGIWVYHARVSFDNDLKSDRNSFVNVLGGGAKIYIKGINKINVLGFGVIYDGRIIPFPVIGFRRQIAENFTMTVVLPVEATFNYKFGPKFETEFKASVTGLKTGFVVDSTNAQIHSKYWNGPVILSNYNLQACLLFIYKPAKNFQIYAEGGIYPFFQLSLTETNEKNKISKYNAFMAPYAGLTFRFNLGKFLFESQMFGTNE
ncbi:MAG: hypothetical protein A2275_08490 [Bacteroidetes bacterium RIFOXYA12_FULL_35_11]|nr:MAG: hypothetical protein A2X01_09305 [Bacteroidetes bacterium GWF2_35_48]OFY75966.1 MAG: hypothetical protein A2275_08490 [Bacteroidetes bacterium RIFOXYA12_FULL_35_11]OFZ00496.1 MAG: hypothetical protein A2491_15815 [Bacteroidetes bacterium RIFOXYC12_FULL_35_7]HBX53671.1 hypothetical protein [Bacteroidales bacterium]